MLNREKRLKFYMIVKFWEFVFSETKFPNLTEKIIPYFENKKVKLELKCSKFEQQPLNIKDLIAQNVTFLLT